MRYANRRTDDGSILPFEVLEPVSPTEMIICEMDCTLRKGWKPIMLLGHCTNEQEQQWDIEVSDSADEVRAMEGRAGSHLCVVGNP